MKKTLTATAIAAVLIAGTAYAGSLSEPVIPPDVVTADAVENASSVEGLLATAAVIAIILGAAGAF